MAGQTTRSLQERDTSCFKSSPLALEMLLHYLYRTEPFIDKPIEHWPVAQRNIIEHMLLMGWLEETRRGALHALTPLGRSVKDEVMTTFRRCVAAGMARITDDGK